MRAREEEYGEGGQRGGPQGPGGIGEPGWGEKEVASCPPWEGQVCRQLDLCDDGIPGGVDGRLVDQGQVGGDQFDGDLLDGAVLVLTKVTKVASVDFTSVR